MKIAVASPPFPKSIADGLYWLEKLTKAAAEKQASLVCFPESFIPGYPLPELTIEATSPQKLTEALAKASQIAAANNIAIILPMDWYTDRGKFNIAHVIDKTGKVLGYQAKNQLDPSEDTWWTPGTERQLFEVDGFKFGVVICHEGFRYPETVRWAARRGAAIVFHPHCSGSDVSGVELTEFRNKNNPYYEQAMMMRALENTIYFASSNYASRFSESASCIVAPDGSALANQPYGGVGVIVADIDTAKATALLANRFKPGLYVE
ncbi:MAG: carbon-nitrogen hydrolase family protein [Bacteroidota bacterium]